MFDSSWSIGKEEAALLTAAAANDTCYSRRLIPDFKEDFLMCWYYHRSGVEDDFHQSAITRIKSQDLGNGVEKESRIGYKVGYGGKELFISVT